MGGAIHDLGDRFRDDGEIGRGARGSVHRVFDRLLGRAVALKRTTLASDPGAVAALLDEARVLSRLDHPNIVPVYDVLPDAAGRPGHVLMKLVEGRSLAAVLAAHGAGPIVGQALERLLRTFLTVCDAVAFAHGRGVVHRDLTPGNVMVGDHGQVYVMDWGLALLRPPSEPAMPPPDALAGTIAYMAPEQARGEHGLIGPHTDVFGLGAILYEILTRRPPWVAPTAADAFRRACAGAVIPPAIAVPDRPLPAGLCRMAMRALAADPRERYASVDALRADVEEFLGGGGWFETARFAAGTVIVREGDAGDCAYIVTAGTCEVYRTSGGTRRVLRVVGPGGVFGEVGLFTTSPRIASVEARTEVTALVVTHAALEHELARSSWMRAMVRATADRFAEADRRRR